MGPEELPDLYLEALELDAAERQALVLRVRSEDATLAAELERLLADTERRPSPIDHSPFAALGLEDALTPELPPQQVGPYRIVRPLGHGGMGQVFLAEQETPHFRRRVALKLIAPRALDPAGVRRFRGELRLLAALDHPGIVRFFDGGRSPEGIWFIAQEYVEGEHLLAHARSRRLGVSERLAFFCQVLDVVAAAHRQGVVHRDLKPSNVLVDPDGRPRLLDFGVSKLTAGAAADATATATGLLAFTPAYASPEQLLGRPATRASDLYSLGVMLYELLVGQRPFARAEGSPAELLRALEERQPDPPSGGGGDLDLICLKALRHHPADRYASAEEFAADLRRHLASEPVEARRDPSGGRAVAVTAEPAIAVLPFADLSPSGDQQYFCDGLAEELIHGLGRVEGLRVVSRTASFQFRGGADPREIGERLRVHTLLDGSVRTTGERLRITVQLVRIADGQQLWSERFDRQLEDVFAIQEEIAGHVADALRLVLASDAGSAARRRQPGNIAAFEFYLRGREYFWRFNANGINYGIEMFRRALELDPDYGLAWAGLADCHSLRRMWFAGSEQDLQAADEASAQALAVSPALPEAHVSRGLAISLHGSYEEASREFAAAVGLDPNLCEAHYFWGRSCFMQGRHDEAAAHFELAEAGSPDEFEPPNFLALSYAALGRKEEQKTALRRAIRNVERHVRVHPDRARPYCIGANALLQLGERDRAFEWCERALAIDPRDATALYCVGCVYALDGQIERGLDLLERAVDTGFGAADWIANDPDWESAREHPRFRAVMARLGHGETR
jgi:serine/threonine protein kinase/tetratricopeptide (TPR) repeat protein